MRLVAIWRFGVERFPAWATVPIAALLFAAPASFGHSGPIEAAEGSLATFLGLLCLRIADDLEDLETDRVLHPERGLPSGRIDAARLREAGLALGVALVALESSSLWRLAFFLGSCAFYRAWYAAWRPRFHRVARPFLSNLVFPLAVLHGAGPVGWRVAYRGNRDGGGGNAHAHDCFPDGTRARAVMLKTSTVIVMIRAPVQASDCQSL